MTAKFTIFLTTRKFFGLRPKFPHLRLFLCSWTEGFDQKSTFLDHSGKNLPQRVSVSVPRPLRCSKILTMAGVMKMIPLPLHKPSLSWRRRLSNQWKPSWHQPPQLPQLVGKLKYEISSAILFLALLESEVNQDWKVVAQIRPFLLLFAPHTLETLSSKYDALQKANIKIEQNLLVYSRDKKLADRYIEELKVE